MIMNIFERAAREKTRFNFKGLISAEDLWDLSLENLDSIWCELEAELEKLPRRSLLATGIDQRGEIEFKQEIIKHIVDTKKIESEARAAAKSNSEKKQMILDIIQAKQNEDLKAKSVEELMQIAENL
jgi:hypothetical protein